MVMSPSVPPYSSVTMAHVLLLVLEELEEVV